jgi:hypothetical protein
VIVVTSARKRCHDSASRAVVACSRQSSCWGEPEGYQGSRASPWDAILLKEKIEINNELPIDAAKEASVLGISHIRVDFQRVEMIGQVHSC